MPRLKGSRDLIFDAVEETTNLVEQMHAMVTKKSVRPFTLVEPLATLVKAVKSTHDLTTSGIYETIRIINRGLKKLIDVGSDYLDSDMLTNKKGEQTGLGTPLRSDAKGSRSWVIDHAESALNAIYGDYLVKKNNDLDLGMNFRHQGLILPVEREALKQIFDEGKSNDGRNKVCVFVHGLGCTEWSWCISAEQFHGDATVNFGTLLKEETGFTPLYVRYNTGRHISKNGRLLSALLAKLISESPVEIDEIVLIGHSMGGLVSRSAAFYGNENDEQWVKRIGHVFCIGSPNLGAPLEKATNVLSSLLGSFETAGTLVPAEILNGRSAGIKDLRFGYTIDDEWMGKDPDAFLKNHRENVQFVDSVCYCFIASTITKDPDHPMGVLLGDMIVRLPSAAGHAPEPARRIPFSSGHVFSGMNHLHLTNHPDVYKAIRNYLT